MSGQKADEKQGITWSKKSGFSKIVISKREPVTLQWRNPGDTNLSDQSKYNLYYDISHTTEKSIPLLLYSCQTFITTADHEKESDKLRDIPTLITA